MIQVRAASLAPQTAPNHSTRGMTSKLGPNVTATARRQPNPAMLRLGSRGLLHRLYGRALPASPVGGAAWETVAGA